MADTPDLATLLTQKLICETEIAQAVDAYVLDPTTTLFVTFGGHRLNLAEAVRSHPFAQQTVGTAWVSQKLKREVVRTAILLARPMRR